MGGQGASAEKMEGLISMIQTADPPSWLKACAAAPLFRELSLERVRTLLDGRVEFRSLSRGQALDGYQRSLGIVTEGRLAVRSTGGALLNQLYPGSMFGVSTVFTGYRSPVTHISAAVNSSVVLIGEQALAAIFAEDFSVNRSYLAFLTDRIRFLNWKIDLFSASTAEQKLRLYLLGLRREGPDVTVEPLARLGHTLGMGRASLYRVIERLEGEGIIRRKTRNCWQIDWEKLERSQKDTLLQDSAT